LDSWNVFGKERYGMSVEEIVIEKDVPPDIRLALETFIEGAKLMEEYKLDFMPTEYLANLFEAISNHPEHQDVLLELINIVEDERRNENG
jgi:hypothetical protein